MRIIFLDFDGVLHPVGTSPDSYIAFTWADTLRRLLTGHPDVCLVVHSTWRYQYRDFEIRELLGPLGERFIGSAPRMPREQAIETVLQSNRELLREHLVLDDAGSEFQNGRVNLLLCEPLTGISTARVQVGILQWLWSTASSAPV